MHDSIPLSLSRRSGTWKSGGEIPHVALRTGRRSGSIARMRIFNIEQSDENIAGRLHTLAFDKLSATEPTADEVLAAGLLVILRRLDELSGDVDELKARAD
jgi:hypothetical protein